jgi:hypothetical protein
MTNGSARIGSRLIANDATFPPRLSLLQHPRFPHRCGTSGNYGKYPPIRIDNVTEQVGANPLTVSAKLLKNNAALSVKDMVEALDQAAPRGLCGLSRVGA